LTRDKGDFKVKHRGDIRQDEREWAAIQKEFGLEEKKITQQGKTSRQDRKLEASKLRTQRLVARIYSAADKKAARAQIRVAQLQLEKGKIDQSQYRHIVNEYRGLPEKGKPGGASSDKNDTKDVGGSGEGGSLAPWERDKIQSGVVALQKTHATARDERKAIASLTERLGSRRLAVRAWRKYIRSLNKPVNEGGRGGRVGDRNQTR
jgi:hypothetical protein